MTKLNFEADERAVKDFDTAVSNLTKGLLAVVGAAKAASAAAFALAVNTAKYGDEVAKTARTLGMGVRELQQYRFAFDRVGIGQEEVTNGLERLSRNLGQAAAGSDSSRKGFDALGISIYNADGSLRQINELMPEIVDGLSSTEGEAQAAAIAADLFGRSGIRLGRALRQGKGELEDLVEEFERLGGGMSEAQAVASEEFMDAMTNMNVILQNLRWQIGTRLFPIFQEMIEAFTDFLMVNRELIIARIHRAFEILIGVVRTTWRVMDALWRVADRVAQSLGGWETTLRLVVAMLGALIATRIVSGVMALSAAITAAGGAAVALRRALMLIPGVLKLIAFAAIIEDLWMWVNENDSAAEHVLGTWSDFSRDWKELVDNLIEGRWFSALGNMDDATDSFAKKVRGYFEGMLPDWLREFIDGGGLMGLIQRGVTGAGEAMGDTDTSGIDALNILGGTAAPTTQMAEGMSESRSVNIEDNRQVTIEVPPGTNQEQIDFIRQEFDRSMQQQLNDAALNLETR